MREESSLLNRLSVASPCSADWDSMAGDGRVRFCGQCDLHVYNVSEMSRGEAVALITKTEGRLCARFYRRADGTVLTKDCPTGLRAVRARAARAAGIVFSAIVSLWSPAAARAARGSYVQGDLRRPVTVKRTVDPDARDATAALGGTVYDPLEAVIQNAAVKLLSEKTKKEWTVSSDDEGVFSLKGLEAGDYTLTIESPGFRPYQAKFSLKSKESVRVGVTLELRPTMGDIVIVPEATESKTETPPPQKVLKPKKPE